MDDGTSFNILPFITIFILLFLNGFFVATEYSMVRMRPIKVEQFLKEGKKGSKYLKLVISQLDTHLAATQLGITLTSLGIGAVSEPAIASILKLAFHSIVRSASTLELISFILAFTIATVLHITIGEQVPKLIAIEKAEVLSLKVAKPIHYFYKIMKYPILLLKGITNSCLRIVGIKTINHRELHTPEEIKMMLTSSELDEDGQKMVSKIFDFEERFIREVMVHRMDMDVIYINDPLEESIVTIKESKHSRFPVCEEDRDDIIGYISVKEIYNREPNEVILSDMIREIPKIYETTTIKKALKMLQKEHHQIGIVIDEYGGVSGLVTIEDILEEIVGEIQDEFDDEKEPFQKMKDSILVNASVVIDDVNEELGLSLEEIDGIDTIGGYVLAKIELPPKVGQVLEIENYIVKILEADEHRIYILEFKENPDYIKFEEE